MNLLLSLMLVTMPELDSVLASPGLASSAGGRAAMTVVDATPPLFAPGREARKQQSLAARRTKLEADLRFLKRAEAAFLFSHRSTAEVKARIRAAEQALARLDEEPPPEPAAELGAAAERAKLEADLSFLKRAEAAFLFSHRSTTEVKERIRAVEQRLRELGPAG